MHSQQVAKATINLKFTAASGFNQFDCQAHEIVISLYSPSFEKIISLVCISYLVRCFTNIISRDYHKNVVEYALLLFSFI